MPRMDHYANGKWKGTTDIPDNPDYSGWVETYTSDGEVVSTMVYRQQQPSNNESSNTSEGNGSAISSAITDAVTYSIIAILLVVLTIGLAPLWYYITKHKISAVQKQGGKPSKFVLTVNKITKVPAKIIIVFYIIGFILLILSVVIGGTIFFSNFDPKSINFM